MTGGVTKGYPGELERKVWKRGTKIKNDSYVVGIFPNVLMWKLRLRNVIYQPEATLYSVVVVATPVFKMITYLFFNYKFRPLNY